MEGGRIEAEFGQLLVMSHRRRRVDQSDRRRQDSNRVDSRLEMMQPVICVGSAVTARTSRGIDRATASSAGGK